jgi:hypothetical protein
MPTRLRLRPRVQRLNAWPLDPRRSPDRAADRRQAVAGGHYAVEVDLRAQFGHGFRPFGAMRRRRNELEYSSGPGETARIRLR